MTVLRTTHRDLEDMSHRKFMPYTLINKSRHKCVCGEVIHLWENWVCICIMEIRERQSLVITSNIKPMTYVKCYYNKIYLQELNKKLYFSWQNFTFANHSVHHEQASLLGMLIIYILCTIWLYGFIWKTCKVFWIALNKIINSILNSRGLLDKIGNKCCYVTADLFS